MEGVNGAIRKLASALGPVNDHGMASGSREGRLHGLGAPVRPPVGPARALERFLMLCPPGADHIERGRKNDRIGPLGESAHPREASTADPSRGTETASQDVWTRMKIYSRQLGEIESVSPLIVHLPEGLIGYEAHQSYYLFSLDDYLPFRWLVSTADHDLCFAVADPGYFIDETYPLTLGSSDAELLDLRATDPLEVYAVLSPDEGGTGITANLKGPLVINARNKLARQVLLYSSRLSVRQPLHCTPWVEDRFRMERTVVRIAGRRVA
jgi:flagellar assembly factor FliW